MSKTKRFIEEKIEEYRQKLTEDYDCEELEALAVTVMIWNDACDGDEMAQFLCPGDFYDTLEQVSAFI